MRKIKFLLMTALLALPLAAFAVPDIDDTIILKRKDPSGADIQRSGMSMEIECHLSTETALLEIHANLSIPSAIVVLEKIDNGAQTRTVINLSPSHSFVVIPSPGDYYLFIILPDGTEYYGKFTLII